MGRWRRKNKNKLVEEKTFLDTVGIKNSYLKGSFLFKSSCKERTQTAMCFLELLGRLTCLATVLDAFSPFLSMPQRCSRNPSPSRLPVSPMYIFLQLVHCMKTASITCSSFGPQRNSREFHSSNVTQTICYFT